jgi:hypothetical protein
MKRIGSILLGACVAAGCGRGQGAASVDPPFDAGSDAGADAGSGRDGGDGTDGGATDGGATDGGGGTDGGASDASVVITSSEGWSSYGPNDGLDFSRGGALLGVSADEGGNLWVSGGSQGVFVLRAGSKNFQRFDLGDGLHPYGYLPDGSPSDRNPILNALSISGGPAGTAFVGYAGKSGCEDNWDVKLPLVPDPAIYKSGDADKVTLNGGGISVVHYDIFSGPNVVNAEMRGRERLCSILRVVYQHGTNWVWFGGNHGFALGLADFGGNSGCNGQLGCAGVWEHVHPAINGYASDDPSDMRVWLFTGDYYGVSVDPLTSDVWFGGLHRSTRFKFATSGASDAMSRYFDAELKTEDTPYVSNRIDVWPDLVGEASTPRPFQRVDDRVSAIAGMPDGSAWVASYVNGLRRISGSGALLGDATARLLAQQVTALVRDPANDSLWIGYQHGGSVSRLMADGSIRHYQVFPPMFQNSEVHDIQIMGSGASRKLLVGFQMPAAVYVFSGN